MKNRKLYAFLLLFVGAGSAFAVESDILIDFTQYDELVQEVFDATNSYVYYDDGIPTAVLGWSDYLLSNWTVTLNSSAAAYENRLLSYCQPVYTSHEEFEDEVLGVRIHFPTWNNNSYAIIHPVFDIKVYDDEGNFINQENGVLTNAWEIKNMSVWVCGRGFNYQLAVRLKDRDENITEIYLGSLDFVGWRQLFWENPNFPTPRFNTIDLDSGPAYPKDLPYWVFDSFVISRLGSEDGGDFVTYIGSVEMEYSLYYMGSELSDIDDEAAWGIIKERGEALKVWENQQVIQEILSFEQERARLGF